MPDVTTFQLGPLQTNCFVLEHDGKALAVDPGGNPTPVLKHLEAAGLALECILNTHLHFDHTAGNAALARATGAPVLAADGDTPLLDTWLGSGGEMGLPRIEPYEFEAIGPGETEFLGLACTVLATPGHSEGSLSFYFPDASACFVGDLIFKRSIGRTDFPGGSMDVLEASVREKIFTLPGETMLYNGHGPATTVADEQAHNPYFSPGAF